jgi:hypothetical protein
MRFFPIRCPEVLGAVFNQVSVAPLYWQLAVTRVKVPLLGLITWANVGLGLVARAINTWFVFSEQRSHMHLTHARHHNQVHTSPLRVT